MENNADKRTEEEEENEEKLKVRRQKEEMEAKGGHFHMTERQIVKGEWGRE